jgi:hypothetical protein
MMHLCEIWFLTQREENRYKMSVNSEFWQNMWIYKTINGRRTKKCMIINLIIERINSSSNGIGECQTRTGWMKYVESRRSEITYVNT